MALDTSWMDSDIACADHPTKLFYPSRGETGSGNLTVEQDTTAEAKAICNRCTKREVCLAYAIAANEKDGIWGGMTRHERVIYAERGHEQLTLGR